MNFKHTEISKWYETKAGDINPQLITDAISKVFYATSDKKIIYFAENLPKRWARNLQERGC